MCIVLYCVLRSPWSPLKICFADMLSYVCTEVHDAEFYCHAIMLTFVFHLQISTETRMMPKKMQKNAVFQASPIFQPFSICFKVLPNP